MALVTEGKKVGAFQKDFSFIFCVWNAFALLNMVYHLL